MNNSIRHNDQIARQIFHNLPIEITLKRVMLSIARYARQNSQGEWQSYPSKQTMATDAGVSPRTVQSALSKLAELGLIRIGRRLTLTSLYTLNLERIWKPTKEILNATLCQMGESMQDYLGKVLAYRKGNHAPSKQLASRPGSYPQGGSNGLPDGEQRIAKTPGKGGATDCPQNKAPEKINQQEREQPAQTRDPRSTDFVKQGASTSTTAARLSRSAAMAWEALQYAVRQGLQAVAGASTDTDASAARSALNAAQCRLRDFERNHGLSPACAELRPPAGAMGA